MKNYSKLTEDYFELIRFALIEKNVPLLNNVYDALFDLIYQDKHSVPISNVNKFHFLIGINEYILLSVYPLERMSDTDKKIFKMAYSNILNLKCREPQDHLNSFIPESIYVKILILAYKEKIHKGTLDDEVMPHYNFELAIPHLDASEKKLLMKIAKDSFFLKQFRKSIKIDLLLTEREITQKPLLVDKSAMIVDLEKYIPQFLSTHSISNVEARTHFSKLFISLQNISDFSVKDSLVRCNINQKPQQLLRIFGIYNLAIESQKDLSKVYALELFLHIDELKTSSFTDVIHQLNCFKETKVIAIHFVEEIRNTSLGMEDYRDTKKIDPIIPYQSLDHYNDPKMKFIHYSIRYNTNSYNLIPNVTLVENEKQITLDFSDLRVGASLLLNLETCAIHFKDNQINLANSNIVELHIVPPVYKIDPNRTYTFYDFEIINSIPKIKRLNALQYKADESKENIDFSLLFGKIKTDLEELWLPSLCWEQLKVEVAEEEFGQLAHSAYHFKPRHCLRSGEVEKIVSTLSITKQRSLFTHILNDVEDEKQYLVEKIEKGMNYKSVCGDIVIDDYNHPYWPANYHQPDDQNWLVNFRFPVLNRKLIQIT